MIAMGYDDIMRNIEHDRLLQNISNSKQHLMEEIEKYNFGINHKPDVKHIKLHSYTELNARKELDGIILTLRPSTVSVFNTLAEEDFYYPYRITEQSNLLPSFSKYHRPRGNAIVKIYTAIQEDTHETFDENIGKYVWMVVRYESSLPTYKAKQPVGYCWSRVSLKLLKSKEFFVEHIFREYNKAIKESLKYTIF